MDGYRVQYLKIQLSLMAPFLIKGDLKKGFGIFSNYINQDKLRGIYSLARAIE